MASENLTSDQGELELTLNKFPVSPDAAPRITKHQRRKSMRFAYITSIAAIVGTGGFVGSVLNVLAIKLGAGEIALGVLTFATLLPFAAGLFSMSAIERHGKKKVIFRWFLITAFLAVPFLFLPLMVKVLGWSAQDCLLIIIAATFLRSMTNSLGTTGWFPLLQDVVPRPLTGTFFGNMRTAWQSAYLLFLLFTAFFLGDDPPWWKFEVIFIFSFICLLIRALAILPMTENPPTHQDKPVLGIIGRLVELWGIKPMRAAALYMLFYSFAANASFPFIVKMMKNIGYGDGWVLGATAISSLGAVISLRWWGKIADSFGNRAVFSLSHLGIILCTVLWGFLPGMLGMPAIFTLFFAASVFNSGNGIAQTRYLFHTVASDRQNYMNLITTMATAAAAFGPLFAGLFLWLLRDVRLKTGVIEINNYQMFFLINALVFVIPHMLRKQLRAGKELPTTAVLSLVLTRPTRYIMGPFINLDLRIKK